jgi:predicted PurR-regulated permease PerM
MKEQLIAKVRQQAQEGVSGLISAIPRAGLKALAVASDLVYVIIVPILAFFFLKDARRIRAHTIDLLDEGPQREFLEDLMADVHVLLAQYMRALLILCCATFICYGICFEILGLPYAILLAALAFALEFIPMVGPLTAAAVILLVTALSGGPLLIVLIFLGAYRMFQDYILSPHLMSSGAELHPLLVLFGVFAGAEIAGIAGTFLSVPVLAMVRILYFRIRKSRLASRLAPTQPVV